MYEGFGLPVIEAMACGCPVITCRGGSIPEVAGNDVIYVAPDNPSETLEAMLTVQSNKTRKKLSEVGLQRAALFTWPKMATAVQNAAEKFTSRNLLDIPRRPL